MGREENSQSDYLDFLPTSGVLFGKKNVGSGYNVTLLPEQQSIHRKTELGMTVVTSNSVSSTDKIKGGVHNFFLQDGSLTVHSSSRKYTLITCYRFCLSEKRRSIYAKRVSFPPSWKGLEPSSASDVRCVPF